MVINLDWKGGGRSMPDPRRVVIEAGQGLIEYALIIILVAMIVLILLTLFGESVGNLFSNIVQGI